MSEDNKKLEKNDIKGSLEEPRVTVERKIDENVKEKEKEVSLEELTERVQNEGKKLISVKDLNFESETKLQYSLKELEKLRKEVVEKFQNIAAQKETIDRKVGAIKKSGKIKFDEDDEKKSQEAVKNYIFLLQNILKELTDQIQFFAIYFSDKKPEKIIVQKDDFDDFNQYILHQVKKIGRYIKNVRKNLNVLFSRYQISFKSQISNLDYLQSYLKILVDKEKAKNKN